MNICALIPAYNESETIGRIVEQLKTRNIDVMVVNDGSTDETEAFARQKGAEVMTQIQKSGKGQALQKGFGWVLSQGYDGVVILDGDGQHDVDDIDHFLKTAHKRNAGLIVGNRMDNVKSMPLIRYWTNRFMSGLISLACGQSIADTQCGYRYIRADVLKNISFESGDFEIETEMLMKAAKHGVNICSVPIKTIYRNEKSKIYPVKDTIRFFVYFIKEITSKDR